MVWYKPFGLHINVIFFSWTKASYFVLVWLKAAHHASSCGRACQRLLKSSFMHLSHCCYDTVWPEWKNMGFVLEWHCWVRAFFVGTKHLTLVPWLQNWYTPSLHFNIFFFQEEIIIFLGILQKRGLETMRALGCCSARLRHTTVIESINMRAFWLGHMFSGMLHIVSITDPLASW